MKTIYALFSTAIATVIFTFLGLLMTGCGHSSASNNTETENIPVVPATLVYSIDAPTGGFDRDAIAYNTNSTPANDNYKAEGIGKETTLLEAFDSLDIDFALSNLPVNDNDASNEISIVYAVTCNGIIDHEPAWANETFKTEDGKVWLFTQIAMPEGKSGLISHLWKFNGKLMSKVDLQVMGPNYRTESFKSIDTSSIGAWTVEVTTANGEVLETVDFFVE